MITKELLLDIYSINEMQNASILKIGILALLLMKINFARDRINNSTLTIRTRHLIGLSNANYHIGEFTNMVL